MGGQVYNKVFTPERWNKVNPLNKNIIDDYLQEIKSQKKSSGTIKQYHNDLRIVAIYISEQLDNKSFLELKKRDFRNFVLWADEECGMSNARINRLMSAVRTLTSFLEDDEDEYKEYDRSAAAKIKGLPKQNVRDIEFIKNEYIEQLYNKLMQEERYKEATLLAILYDSGCRKNEILQVERASITMNGNTTNKVVGKRGKVFPVLYFNHTKQAFKKYEKNRTDENPMLFITAMNTNATSASLYDWVVGWKKDLKEVSGEDFLNLNVHTFRHCFIENLTNGTHWLCEELGLGEVRLDQVKSLVHHNDISTTDGYRSNNEERDIENLLGIKL